MIVHFAHAPSFPATQPSFSSRFLLEPLLVAGTSIFWVIILLISALFCASVALYDHVAVLSTRQFRHPLLRPHIRANPLVLRQKARRSDEQPAPADSVHHPVGV